MARVIDVWCLVTDGGSVALFELFSQLSSYCNEHLLVDFALPVVLVDVASHFWEVDTSCLG